MSWHTYIVHRGFAGRCRVHFRCGRCGGNFDAPLQAAGEAAQCPDCGAAIIIPGEAEKAQADQQHRAISEKRAQGKQ